MCKTDTKQNVSVLKLLHTGKLLHIQYIHCARDANKLLYHAVVLMGKNVKNGERP